MGTLPLLVGLEQGTARTMVQGLAVGRRTGASRGPDKASARDYRDGTECLPREVPMAKPASSSGVPSKKGATSTTPAKEWRTYTEGATPAVGKPAPGSSLPDADQVYPAEPEAVPKRRRGRPPADPDKGAATMGERAASHRERIGNEILELITLLRTTMHALAQGGDHHTVGLMFWARHRAALDAIRPHQPRTADELEELQMRSKAYLLKMDERRKDDKLPRGLKKGSIVVGDSVFSLDTTGTVLRDGARTEFRLEPLVTSWHLVEERRKPKDRSTRDSNLADASEGLLAAATLIVQREKGSPLATNCPGLGTFIRSRQTFSMPPDLGPPTRGVNLNAECSPAVNGRATASGTKPSQSAPEVLEASDLRDSVRMAGVARGTGKAAKRPRKGVSKKSPAG